MYKKTRVRKRSARERATLYKIFLDLGMEASYKRIKGEFRTMFHYKDYILKRCKPAYDDYRGEIKLEYYPEHDIDLSHKDIYEEVVSMNLKPDATVGDCKGKTKEEINKLLKNL